MEIVTDRFVFRDFVEKDSPAFAAYHADPRSLDLYGDEPAKPGHARELLELFKSWAEERPRRNYQLAIIQRKEPQLLSESLLCSNIFANYEKLKEG
jgi:[ribosomal protein S5]-alanine N-acetyltransferase